MTRSRNGTRPEPLVAPASPARSPRSECVSSPGAFFVCFTEMQPENYSLDMCPRLLAGGADGLPGTHVPPASPRGLFRFPARRKPGPACLWGVLWTSSRLHTKLPSPRNCALMRGRLAVPLRAGQSSSQAAEVCVQMKSDGARPREGTNQQAPAVTDGAADNRAAYPPLRHFLPS